MIAGLELPSSGRILLDGEDVTFRRAAERDIAFVFQLFALYPHMNVRQNIGFPLKCQGMPRAEIRGRAWRRPRRLLRIDHLLERGVSRTLRRRPPARGARPRDRAPAQGLPDGRAAGRARRRVPPLMCGELRELHDRIGATTVYVTHDQLEAMAMADRIAVMNQGVVEQVGTPQEIYDRPASMFVADFIGSPPMNFLRFEGEARPGDRQVALGGIAVPVPELREAAAGTAFALGVRPEHVRFDDASALRGTVFGAEYLGTTQIVTARHAHGPVKARISSARTATLGETVGLALPHRARCRCSMERPGAR